MANHGPLCKRIKSDKENILKSIMWKGQSIYDWCVSKVLQYMFKLMDQKIFTLKNCVYLNLCKYLLSASAMNDIIKV